MIPVKVDVSTVFEDNIFFYLTYLRAAVQHADPEAELAIKQTTTGYAVIVNPGTPEFRQDIIDNILGFHKKIKIIPRFSKSTKIQKSIYYNIEIPQD